MKWELGKLAYFSEMLFNLKINKLADSSEADSPEWVTNLKTSMQSIIDDIMWPAIAIILTLGLVYVIILGVNYAKAETSDKKEEAKKRIINAIVGVIIMLALIAILKVVLDNMPAIVSWVDQMAGESGSSA